MLEVAPHFTVPARSDVEPWQRESWKELLSLLGSERLPHALLLEGAPGTGRNRLALALARYMLCTAPEPDGNCGRCKSCALSASGAHADFLPVLPAEEGKAIGVDAVRSTIRFASTTATQGARKVIVISPAEAMTTAAFNAFLKCLEEPAADTYIMLVCRAGYPLPATIRSRCRQVALSAPDSGSAHSWISKQLAKSGAEIDSEAISGVLELSGGRPLSALRRLQEGDTQSALEFHAAAAGVTRGDRAARAVAERCAAALDPDELLELTGLCLRQWLREQPAEVLRSTAGQRGFAALALLGELEGARRAGTNPNPDLLRFRVLDALNGLWD